VRRCSSPRQLSAQTTRLPERGSIGLRVALQLLLQSLPAAHDLDVGAFPGPARVSRAGGGAGFCPACRAEPSGGAAVRALNIPVRTLQRWRQWWQKQFPLTRSGKPAAPASCPRWRPTLPCQSARTVFGSCRRSADATAGLSVAAHGQPIDLPEGR
jgi:hypothetical protein